MMIEVGARRTASYARRSFSMAFSTAGRQVSTARSTSHLMPRNKPYGAHAIFARYSTLHAADADAHAEWARKISIKIEMISRWAIEADYFSKPPSNCKRARRHHDDIDAAVDNGQK